MDGNPADVPIAAPFGVVVACSRLSSQQPTRSETRPCGQTRTGHPGLMVTIGRGDRVELDLADTLIVAPPTTFEIGPGCLVAPAALVQAHSASPPALPPPRTPCAPLPQRPADAERGGLHTSHHASGPPRPPPARHRHHPPSYSLISPTHRCHPYMPSDSPRQPWRGQRWRR